MTIEAKLDDDLKSSMRSRDADRLACIRQLRSKVQEARNAPDFKGPADDAFYQSVIASYVRSLEKGIAELEAAKERGQGLRERYAAEVAYLKQYLPQLLDETRTRALVDEAVAKLGGPAQAKVGAVVGAVVKEHKGVVDPALVRKLAESALVSTQQNSSGAKS
jgi:uncharacterized protein YqeY